MVKYCYRWQSKFQSTLSMRRATETPAALQLDHVISIHALHEESDMSDNVNHPKHYEFQSTLSMRRATGHAQRSARPRPISIHALHEESDGCFRRHRLAVHISIHALHEESD